MAKTEAKKRGAEGATAAKGAKGAKAAKVAKGGKAAKSPSAAKSPRGAAKSPSGKAAKAPRGKAAKSPRGAAKSSSAAAAAASDDDAAAAAPPPPSVAQLARQCFARVSGFAFDDPQAPPPQQTFLGRYAADFGLAPPASAHAHAREYLKFMALKAALQLSGAPMVGAATGITPPLAVDAVWHTHLVFSRSYARLCEVLLGSGGASDADAAPSAGIHHFIHHEPSPGGAAAAALFIAQYVAAVTMYFDAFGFAPPADVWTPAAHRFAPHNGFVCVSRGERDMSRSRLAQMLDGMGAAEYEDASDSFGGMSGDDGCG